MNTMRARSAMVLLVAGLSMPFTGCSGAQVFDSGVRQVTLLELFTSEGCSSCPPAERWLHEYAGAEVLWSEVVPLAWHVDYWDYLGWQDRLARPEYGARQSDLARSGGRGVYTPGFFVNGREWRGWVLRLPPRAADREPGALRVVVDGGRLDARFPAGGHTLELHVALLAGGIVSRVGRGENRGRELEQEFVVLAHSVMASDDGHWELPMPHTGIEAGTRRALAVWVSAAGSALPVQATGGWLDAPVVN